MSYFVFFFKLFLCKQCIGWITLVVEVFCYRLLVIMCFLLGWVSSSSKCWSF